MGSEYWRERENGKRGGGVFALRGITCGERFCCERLLGNENRHPLAQVPVS